MIPRELFKKIRRVEVRTKGLVENLFGGEYHSAFRGRGIEFAEVRPYQVGDDVRTIDWNVSARTGHPFVKVFEEEREQTLMLAVDVSGSADFGTAGRTKRDLAAEIAAVLAFSAVRNGDRVGLLLFSDRVERLVPPRKGLRHALRLVRDLYVHPPSGRGTRVAAARTARSKGPPARPASGSRKSLTSTTMARRCSTWRRCSSAAATRVPRPAGGWT